MPAVGPLRLYRTTVSPDWIDYNGHMNVAYYVLVFDQATDVFLERIGLGPEERKTLQGSIFSVEGHITYQREVNLGDPLVCDVQLLGFDEKRIRFITIMRHETEGFVAATMEWVHLYMDMKLRKVAPMPKQVREDLQSIMNDHALLEMPTEAGRAIAKPPLPGTQP